nr:retrovirus-related Pol polyprotein from transposon TNT 1-94 [Tanacetum cinerariifolium]
MKNKLSAHQDTISILTQQKDAQIKLYKTREDKELEKVIELENKVKFLDNIVYKTGQSVQTMNMLNNKCRMSFAKPEYLMKAKQANPCLYDICCYNDNLALMLAPESNEVIRLENESRSKLSDLIRPFDYDKLNSLYDLFVPQREKSSEQRYFSERSRMSHINVNNEKKKDSFNKQTTLLEKRMDKSIPLVKNCQSSLEIVKVKMNINTIITGVELCKQKIANRTYIGYIDPFIKNTIENFFCLVISRINVGIDLFLKSLNEEMVADLRYFNSLELEVDSLTSQLETQRTQFLNEIDRLSREHYYANHMHAILGVYTELDDVTNLQCDYLELLQKCECLETELSKSKTMSKSFESDKAIAINELKKLIDKLKGKSMDTKFEKSLVIRQPNAFKSQRPSVLGKPTTFSNSFLRKDFSKSTSVTQNNASNDFSKPVTAQTLPTIKESSLNNMNVLAPGMNKLHTDHTQARTSKLPQDYRKTNKRVSFSTGVILSTSVSRPQLKSNPMEDRVLCNNSRGKKQDVEDHRRSVKLSKNKTSVTACNDSLNAKTLNVKSISAMCDKCVLHDKHDMCVLKSVAKPIKRIVSSESNKKPKNFTRKIYEHVIKTCKGILHPTSVARTPEQNGVVERRNRTLIEAARTMLSAAKVPLFLWAEAIATACFTQNRSLVIPRHEKTPYHIINDKKPSVKFFHIFGSVCYIVRDGENLDKMKEKGDECIFVGYSNQSRAYRVFNKGTRVIMESIHVNFDELPLMASDQISSYPAPEFQTTILNHESLSPVIQRQANVPQADRTIKTSNELDLLFSAMFDELLNGSSKVVSKSSVVSAADAPNQRQQYTTPLNNHTTPAPTCQIQTLAPTIISFENINQAKTYVENDQVADDEFINIFSTPVQDQGETSSRHVDSSNMHTFYQRYPSEHRWTKDNPLKQVIRNPSQSVRTRRQPE